MQKTIQNWLGQWLRQRFGSFGVLLLAVLVATYGGASEASAQPVGGGGGAVAQKGAGPILKAGGGAGRARSGSAGNRSSRRLSMRSTRSPEPARQGGHSVSQHISRRVQQATAPREAQKESRNASPVGAKRLSVYSSGSSASQRRQSLQSLSRRSSQASTSERPRSMSLRTAARRASIDSNRSISSTGSRTTAHDAQRIDSAEKRQAPKQRTTSVSEKPGYPPRSGFAGEPKPAELKPGTRFDRYGSERGRFVSPVNTPFPARGLPDAAKQKPYHQYEVVKPISVRTGSVAPWGNSPGMGTQHLLDRPVSELVKGGYLREVR